MLHLEKSPMTGHSSSRSATMPNRSLTLSSSPSGQHLSSGVSPDKHDIALLQEQYRLVYKGRQSLQSKCNALEELLEQHKAERDQLQRSEQQANAELIRLRATTSATVPSADFEALQKQTDSLIPQLEDLRARERLLRKELEEHQVVTRQLQEEIAELQGENDQLRADRATMEEKQTVIEATILEMAVQSGKQDKELEYLRSQLVRSEEEASGLRSVVSQLADSRLTQNQLRSVERRFNSSTVSLVSNLSTNNLSQASSINTLTNYGASVAAAVAVQPSHPLPYNRRSLSAASSSTRRAHPVSRAASITTTTSPSSGGSNHHHPHHHNNNNLGESMAIVRTRDLELQLEERELELQQLREQLDQADGERRTLKEQSALDKECIEQLEQDLREVQSQWAVLVLQNTASAEDLNNNEEEKEGNLELDEQEKSESESEEAKMVNEKLDSLNNPVDPQCSDSKKPKKPSRRWYCIFTVCVTGKKQPQTKGKK